jgi:hypothetical protein
MANAELLKLVQSLSDCLVYTESTNVETNRKLWNRYAEEWTRDAEFVTKMVSNLPGQPDPTEHLVFLGDEWSNHQSVKVVLADYFTPHLTDSTIAVEIGSGGGKSFLVISVHI